jgi:uncharacterized protein YggE
MRLFAITALATIVVVGLASAAEPAGTRPLVPSITVVGAGTVTAKPDMAQIQVGVVTEAPSASEALKQNNSAMENLFRVLKAKGIADKDLQTSNFSVSPQYDRNKQGQMTHKIVGYRVSNQVAVKVRQLSLLGEVLDEAVQEGANQVHGISFSVAEPEQLLDAAREKAIVNARHKAQLYATTAEVKLGEVLLIQEQTPHIPDFQVGFALRSEASGAVPVAPGEQEFRVSINVTYALKP